MYTLMSMFLIGGPYVCMQNMSGYVPPPYLASTGKQHCSRLDYREGSASTAKDLRFISNTFTILIILPQFRKYLFYFTFLRDENQWHKVSYLNNGTANFTINHINHILNRRPLTFSIRQTVLMFSGLTTIKIEQK